MSPNTFVLFCNRLQMYIKVIRVIADNEIIGYVFMGNYTGEFPWFSDKLMQLLAKNLHSTLLGSRSYSTYRFNMHQSVLSDIIEGASEEETIQRINAAKLTFPPNMRAVVLRPSYFRGNEYLYDVLTPRVAEILPASPRVYKKNAIVTFVGVDNAGTLPEETRTAIETLAADGQVLVGVSNLFHKPSKLYVYYQQALQAMSFSRRLSNTGGVFFFSDYAFYIMLDRMEDKPLLEQCRHPVLASLETYDAGKNTELYETLKIYTKTGFSKNRTAELMFMHRNTVNYRIQQIENLFSVDFSTRRCCSSCSILLHRRVFEKPLFDLAPLPENRQANDSTTRARQFCRARARFLLPEQKEHLRAGGAPVLYAALLSRRSPQAP
ncbi:MAG: PucR family transcriptional regulator [Oscillospiraceae bacterium]